MTTVRTVAIDDRVDLLSHLPDDSPLAWVRHGEGLVGWGQAHTVTVAQGEGRFAAADAALRQWFDGLSFVAREVDGPGTGAVAFASVTFDWDEPGSRLVVPRYVLGRRNDTAWLTAIDADLPALPRLQDLPPPVRVRYAGASLPETTWLDAVADAADAVGSGELSKVVLARDLRVWAAEPLDVRPIARRLAERFDGCWTFVCAGLVGATPELLVRRLGAQVESIVLAGSAARGRDLDEDKHLGDTLLHAAKDRIEHDIAVTSVVERLSQAGSNMQADPQPWLLQLANVQHLATRVQATLDEPVSALRLAGLLHPTAAVCGTPRATAMQRIRDTEGMDRARYSGAVGWVDAEGNGEFGIALRCAEVTGNRARLFSGAGIVAESLPELELEETRLKLRAMQSALEGTAP